MRKFEYMVMDNDGDDVYTRTIEADTLFDAAAFAHMDVTTNWVDCRVIEIKEVWG